ncbi:MAG: helicase-related protein [Cyclobacteriaceae bacterium]
MENSIISKLKPNTVIKGNLFPEQVHVIVAMPFGNAIKLIGRGDSNQVYDLVIPEEKFGEIEFIEQGSYNGDSVKFRLAVEALRLGLAYEYDPYFSLSIARVDPLPHQLEAVYDYFLKLPRIRFLLADDPGAGKTIMAGLLIKELKARGLLKRILIVTPANLTFQWQRELKDRFRENFEIIRGDVLRANYGSNPWQEKNQVITSVSWASLQEDANQSLLRATWDLVVVDEAHKMSAYDDEHKTYAYQLGENLSERTDHFLLMTATPHKGDKDQFQLFMRLLDKDVYADISSIDEAIEQRSAPFYLRRVKEALVSFPDPETGVITSLFTKRIVQTIEFKIEDDEWDFYNELTRYVEDQSIRAAADNSARARAVGFTMAMLQRRFASSLYAVRRSLERMKIKREDILRDPEAYKQKQILNKLPENFEDLTDAEQQAIIESLEDAVITYDPNDLRIDIDKLSRLIDQAKQLEAREIENKIVRLKEVLTKQGVFSDPKMKLLIFTEHKDTLDYLVGDGKDGRPLGKLIEWGLKTTQIHGGMKVGDRNTPGTRIYAEREFKEASQILVATEAAGEGINLQFCWFMINYDIPWNPIRLEQRMGRIHRYGQEKDCLILNFVSSNTREGRVMGKLFERIQQIEDDLDPKKTGKVFNVLGDVFPSNQLEKMLREMYAHNLTEEVIKSRIVEQIDTAHFQQITQSTLEGLAKRELNLSAIVGKSAEAKERRLVPEVVQDFFIQSAPFQGLHPKEKQTPKGIFTIGKVPRNLWKRGEENEKRFGIMGHDYGNVAFSKEIISKDNTIDWITPGHPLFEVIREETIASFGEELKKGAVFYDINISLPVKLDIFGASIVDGLGHTLHKRLFVLESQASGTIAVKQPTVFLDIIPAKDSPQIADASLLPSQQDLEQHLVTASLNTYLKEVQLERLKETSIIEKHLELSLRELIEKQNLKLGEYIQQQNDGDTNQFLASNISQTENRVLELTNRLDHRKNDLAKERQCTISGTIHLGTAWVLPHPDRNRPEINAMVTDPEIERIAVQKAIEHEKSLGYEAQSVESENRGFDLISRKPHPEDPLTAIDVKFIEVKGRSAIGEVALTSNEYKTAQRLKKDFYLYVVYNCASKPELHIIKDPAQLGWVPIVKVEHYQLKSDVIINAATK